MNISSTNLDEYNFLLKIFHGNSSDNNLKNLNIIYNKLNKFDKKSIRRFHKKLLKECKYKEDSKVIESVSKESVVENTNEIIQEVIEEIVDEIVEENIDSNFFDYVIIEKDLFFVHNKRLSWLEYIKQSIKFI